MAAVALWATGCGGSGAPPAAPSASTSRGSAPPAAVRVPSASTAAAASGSAPAATKPIVAVGAESEYANVISQVGGRYVRVSAVQSDPNTDPHTFEASASVARELAAAQLVVINGVGYDEWAQRMLAASPNPARRLIDVQQLLGLPDSTPDPHLWYDPKTMPAVARQIAADLGVLQPAHAPYFQANVTRFDHALQPWLAALRAFRAKYAGTPVAVTEPVGDYLLQAAGCDIATPFSLQAAIMNGTDPSPQDVTLQDGLLKGRRVKAFLYNRQVTDTLTASFQNLARQAGVPIVGVYETLPAGYSYQRWMLAETNALRRAVADGTSTAKL